jgi:hypothetical protein
LVSAVFLDFSRVLIKILQKPKTPHPTKKTITKKEGKRETDM